VAAYTLMEFVFWLEQTALTDIMNKTGASAVYCEISAGVFIVALTSTVTSVHETSGIYFFFERNGLLKENITSMCSSVGIATGYGLDDQGGGSSSPGRVNNFHFSISSRPALGSTQPPTKWVPGALFRG
jgi:hypothetical protein